MDRKTFAQYWVGLVALATILVISLSPVNSVLEQIAIVYSIVLVLVTIVTVTAHAVVLLIYGDNDKG